jgi:von Willebrand factor type A domain
VSVSFVTPAAGLVALLVLLPLGALLFAQQSLESLCDRLRIRPPGRRGAVTMGIAFVLFALFVGLAAAQPVVSSRQGIEGRKDAETFFIFDVSRSMSARPGPTEPTRLARAREAAKQLRNELGDVPVGVASFTDRLLPHLFPTVSTNTLLATMDRAIGIDRPPAGLPWGDNLGTKLGSIGDIATAGYFSPESRRRAAVVFTDGETLPDDISTLSERLQRGNVRLYFVRIWGVNERVYERGLVNTAYVPDPTSESQLADLGSQLGAGVFTPDEMGAAARALREVMGKGPTGVRGYELRSSQLAPYVFLLSLVPLLLLLWRRNLPPAAHSAGS